MDKTRVFGYLENSDIEILSFNDKYFDQCVTVLDSLYFNAGVYAGLEINLPESSQARAELTAVCKVMAEDGISLMARDVKLDKIVGITFNKIQVNSNSNEVSDYFTFRTRNTQSENGKALLQLLMDIDKVFDCYRYFETDCIFDISFLSTLIPAYEKRSIGKMLTFYSMELAKELNEGKSLELLPRSLQHFRPGAITAVFSSTYAQKIGHNLGFESLYETFYKDLKYKEKNFSERITTGHDSMIVAGKKL